MAEADLNKSINYPQLSLRVCVCKLQLLNNVISRTSASITFNYFSLRRAGSRHHDNRVGPPSREPRGGCSPPPPGARGWEHFLPGTQLPRAPRRPHLLHPQPESPSPHPQAHSNITSHEGSQGPHLPNPQSASSATGAPESAVVAGVGPQPIRGPSPWEVERASQGRGWCPAPPVSQDLAWEDPAPGAVKVSRV